MKTLIIVFMLIDISWQCKDLYSKEYCQSILITKSSCVEFDSEELSKCLQTCGACKEVEEEVSGAKNNSMPSRTEASTTERQSTGSTTKTEDARPVALPWYAILIIVLLLYGLYLIGITFCVRKLKKKRKIRKRRVENVSARSITQYEPGSDNGGYDPETNVWSRRTELPGAGQLDSYQHLEHDRTLSNSVQQCANHKENSKIVPNVTNDRTRIAIRPTKILGSRNENSSPDEGQVQERTQVNPPISLDAEGKEIELPPARYEDVYPGSVGRGTPEIPDSDFNSNVDGTSISYPQTSHGRRSQGICGSHCSPVVEIPEVGEEFELRYSDRSGFAPEIQYMSSYRQDGTNSTIRLLVGDKAEVLYASFQAPSHFEAKDALIQYAKNKPLCSHKQARRCEIKNMRTWCAFRYTLKTMTEDRVFYKKTRPYVKGQKIDEDNGCRIDLYDINISRPVDFCNDDAVVKVPHTERKIRCTDCSGSGRSTCRTCDGSGTVPCIKCHGSDGDRNYSCQCHGGGNRCWTCGGNRTVRCNTCKESGWVVCYKQLKITWSTTTSDYVDEHPSVPTMHLLNEKGRRVYSKKAQKLKPLEETDILHKQIHRYSKLHLEKHNSLGAVTLLQKQVVDIVPVHAIDCQYRQKNFRFYMIGENCKIHAPDYPGKFFLTFSCFH